MREDLHTTLGERLRELFRNYIGYLAVALVSLAYIATSFLTLGATGKGIGEIVADGAVAFLLGIMINRMFDAQGLRNGDRDARVCEAEARHAAFVERVCPYLDTLDAWCETKNREALARARRQYLSRYGMRYGEYFFSDGTPMPYVPLGEGGMRARVREACRYFRFRRARAIRLTHLSAGLLISDTGNPNDPYYMGRSKKEYTRTSGRRDLLGKLLTAALFGYYGVSLLQSFSPADLIWTVLQVGLFLLMGSVKMEQSYLYVTDEYRARLTKKADLLQMFENYLEKTEESYGKEQYPYGAEEGKERTERSEEAGRDVGAVSL